MTEAILLIIDGIVTIIVAIIQHTQNNKHSCRQSIMQLITEDHLRVLEGHLPENKRTILDEYDEYSRSGGNHWTKDKVEEYLKWYSEQNGGTKK